MKLNPEFERNVWLECTLHKMIVLPVVILLVVYLTFEFNNYKPYKHVYIVCAIGYFILAGLWGVRLAVNSVIGEVREKTWDNQRMTSMGAWSMTWGKLFGSTSLVWFGSLICLFLMLLTYQQADWTDYRGSAHNKWAVVSIFLLAGLLVQATAFFIGLSLVRTGSGNYRTAGLAALVVSIFVISFSNGLVQNLSAHARTEWYGGKYSASGFTLTSLAVLFFWLLLGCYRLMRLELQQKNRPLVWLAFVIYMSVYIAGFFSWVPNEKDRVLASVMAAYMVVWTSVYLALFSENKEPIAFRRLFYNLREGRWQLVLQSIQAWMVSLVLLFILLLFVLTLESRVIDFLERQMSFRFALINAFIFLLRDIAIVLFFNFGRKRSKADVTAFFYLVMLYSLIPALVSIGNNYTLIALFIPWGAENTGLTLVSGLIQLGIMVYLVISRWQKTVSVSEKTPVSG